MFDCRKTLKRAYWIYLRIIKGGFASFGFANFGKQSVLCHPMRIVGKKYVYIDDNCFIMDGLRLESINSWGG